MKIYRKILTIGAVVGSCLSCVGTAAAKDEISVITNNRSVWKYSPKSITHRFADFNWKSTKNGFLAGSESDLMFWEQDVQSVVVDGKGAIDRISINVIADAQSMSMNNAGFKKLASTWKQLLDEKSSMNGKPLALIRRDGIETQCVTWELPEAFVMLKATWKHGPRSLDVSIYPKNYSKQVIAAVKKRSSTNKPSKAASSDSLIAKALKGNTYYLSGNRFNKNDISGRPDYYLVYFSASW